MSTRFPFRHSPAAYGKSLASTGFTRWSTLGAQPDDVSPGEDCGSVHRNGGLNDFSCDKKAPFFCEKDLYPSSDDNTLGKDHVATSTDQPSATSKRVHYDVDVRLDDDSKETTPNSYIELVKGRPSYTSGSHKDFDFNVKGGKTRPSLDTQITDIVGDESSHNGNVDYNTIANATGSKTRPREDTQSTYAEGDRSSHNGSVDYNTIANATGSKTRPREDTQITYAEVDESSHTGNKYIRTSEDFSDPIEQTHVGVNTSATYDEVLGRGSETSDLGSVYTMTVTEPMTTDEPETNDYEDANESNDNDPSISMEEVSPE